MFIQDNPKTTHLREDEYAEGLVISFLAMTVFPMLVITALFDFHTWVVFAKTYVLNYMLLAVTQYAVVILSVYFIIPLLLGIVYGMLRKRNSSYFLGFLTWLFLWFAVSGVYVVVR